MKKTNRYLLEGTTILSFLTGVIYFFPYTYQSAFLSYFGLPTMYQSLDLKSSLDASYSLFMYMIIIIVLIGLGFCAVAGIDKFIVNKAGPVCFLTSGRQRAIKGKTIKE